MTYSGCAMAAPGRTIDLRWVSDNENDPEEISDSEPPVKRRIRMVPLLDLHRICQLYRLGIPLVLCNLLMLLMPTFQD